MQKQMVSSSKDWARSWGEREGRDGKVAEVTVHMLRLQDNPSCGFSDSGAAALCHVKLVAGKC